MAHRQSQPSLGNRANPTRRKRHVLLKALTVIAGHCTEIAAAEELATLVEQYFQALANANLYGMESGGDVTQLADLPVRVGEVSILDYSPALAEAIFKAGVAAGISKVELRAKLRSRERIIVWIDRGVLAITLASGGGAI